MTTLYSLTQSAAIANLRTDLSDTDSTNYRWKDPDLQRALDRAVERYSWAAPRFQSVQIPTITRCAVYASPAGAWYVDKVEYPAGRYPKNFPPFLERKSPFIMDPTASTGTPAISLGAGGGLSAGAYQWAYSFVVPGGGETKPSPVVSATATNGQGATLTAVPVGPYGVSARNIYRTKANGTQLYLAGQIADNVTGSFLDTVADASLVTLAPVANTTQDLDQFELQIPPELYPSDTTTYVVEVTIALKHELDALGTTIPERHWDAIYLGGVAYAMFAYLPQVNDNFEYADGHLRDRVDDTASAVAWRTQCQMAMHDFERRLVLIKEETNVAIAGQVHWGDKPLRWERL